jgi:hypothetical protein
MRSPNSRHGRHRVRQFSRVAARVEPIELSLQDEEARLASRLETFETRVRAARYGRIVDEPARSPRGEHGVPLD